MSEKHDVATGEKPKYESPTLLELGALARGMGGKNCSIGTSPTATCLPGGAAAGLCTIGGGVA